MMTDENQPNEKPKIHIDSDWKAQAQAEKQRLAEQAKQRQQQQESEGQETGDAASGTAGGAAEAAQAGRQRGQGGLPEPSFQTLVSTMVTQALFAMGAIPDPNTGQRVAHLDLARHHIDMLGVLEEKTKGNLEEDEQKMLSNALYELRMQYTELSRQAMNQATGQGQGGQGGQGGAGQGPLA
jgi:hypothetical protein